MTLAWNPDRYNPLLGPLSPFLPSFWTEGEIVRRANELSRRWDVLVLEVTAAVSTELVEATFLERIRSDKAGWDTFWRDCVTSWWCRASGQTGLAIADDWEPAYDAAYREYQRLLPGGTAPSSPGPYSPRLRDLPWYVKLLAGVGGVVVVGAVGYGVYRYYRLKGGFLRATAVRRLRRTA